MKKLITISIALFLTGGSYAQNLERKIPYDAFAVSTVKGDKAFKLMLVKDFDNSFIGRAFLDKVTQETEHSFQSIDEFGFDLDEEFYYFHLQTDSINYNCILMPIKDVNKFDVFMNTKNNEITQKEDQKTYIFDEQNLAIWDNEKILYISGSSNYLFFTNEENAARYGIVDYEDYQWSATEEVGEAVYDDDDMVEEVWDVDDKTKEIWEAVEAVYNDDEMTEEVWEVEDVAVPTEIAYDSSEEDVDEHVYYYEEDTYESSYNANLAIKNALVQQWTHEMGEWIFNANFSSIQDNKSYTSSKNNHALASLWVSNIHSLYGNMMTGIIPTYQFGATVGFGKLNVDLFMDDKEMRIKSDVVLDKENARAYKRMLKNKLNRKFYKYVDSENLIGFGSYAINTQAYLEEFPRLFSQTYGTVLGTEYQEIVEFGSELFSLLLDEKAIGKVIKGDALWLLNGVSPKEVSYISYDYDDEYEVTQVEKTKVEMQPDFLMMFSSDDTRIFEKLLKLGIKEEIVSLNNHIYHIHSGKSPFDIFVTMTDGIVFIGTSSTDLIKIHNHQFNKSISRTDKKLLKGNNITMLFNPENLTGKIPAELLEDEEKMKTLNESLNGMNKIYFKSSSIRKNTASAELIAEVPEDQDNALKYFFYLIEKAGDL